MLGPYTLAAEAGASLAQAGMLCIASGLIASLFLVIDRRMLASVPSEVTGVVTFSIGAAVVARVHATAGLQTVDPGTLPLIAVGLATFVAIGLLALLPGLAGRFALPLGAAAGTAAALLLDFAGSGEVDRISAAPWLAPLMPMPPTFAMPDLTLLPAFLIGVLATPLASQSSLLAIQRAGDAAWRRPDVPPIRRGLLSMALTVAGAGAVGGMAPVTSSANVALSVQARVLSRSVVLVGSATLTLLAMSPKLVAALVGPPAPVKAGLLLYLGCVLMAAGCQSIASRALDARRTLVVGAGLSAAMLLLALPPALVAALPIWLRSPMVAGAVTALSLHVLTVMLVAKRMSVVVSISPAVGQDIADRCTRIAGAWGLRKEVAMQLERALVELAEVLAMRGQSKLEAQLRRTEVGVQVRLLVEGPALAIPGGHTVPSPEDLLGDEGAQERFIVWVALRQAERITQRRSGASRHELEFLVPSTI
jgi:xanthine permease XanP